MLKQQSIKNLNVAILAGSFLLVLTSVQTITNAQAVILASAKNSTLNAGYVPGFTGNGYTSLAFVYLVFTFANFLAPPVVSFFGPKMNLFFGSISYAVYVLQFAFPNDALLYGSSAFLGFGAAFFWVAQGTFLTLNSDSLTMERNTGLFWAVLQSSQLAGNLYIYLEFQDMDYIDSATRFKVSGIEPK